MSPLWICKCLKICKLTEHLHVWRHTLFYFNADEDCRPVIIKLMLYLHLIKQHPLKPSPPSSMGRRCDQQAIQMTPHPHVHYSPILPMYLGNGGYCRAIDAALSVTNCWSLELIGFNLLCWLLNRSVRADLFERRKGIEAEAAFIF